jgi:hypothetical protein
VRRVRGRCTPSKTLPASLPADRAGGIGLPPARLTGALTPVPKGLSHSTFRTRQPRRHGSDGRNRARPGPTGTTSLIMPRMVCPGESARCPGRGDESLSRCTDLAGESPAPVGAGAPGSGRQARGETSASQAGRQEPLRRERAHGPRHEVNPTASTDLPRGSRAAHVTAKATSVSQRSGGESVGGPPGVQGAAREQGWVRKRRDPSTRPSSRQGGPYEPKVKSGAVQRESEGAVVPVMAATNNAAGGRGPQPRAAPPARNRPVPGGSVKLARQRPPASRVPEIGTDGLTGGLAETSVGDHDQRGT